MYAPTNEYMRNLRAKESKRQSTKYLFDKLVISKSYE